MAAASAGIAVTKKAGRQPPSPSASGTRPNPTAAIPIESEAT